MTVCVISWFGIYEDYLISNKTDKTEIWGLSFLPSWAHCYNNENITIMSIMILTAETTMTIIIIHMNHIVDSHEMFIFYIFIYILIFIDLFIIYSFFIETDARKCQLRSGVSDFVLQRSEPMSVSMRLPHVSLKLDWESITLYDVWRKITLI